MIITTKDIRRMRRLRYEHGLTRAETAVLIGCNVDTVGKYAPGLIGKIPNDKLREAFLASGVGAAEVARRIGWRCSSTKRGASGQKIIRPSVGDGSRVKRTLGILPDCNGRGIRSLRTLIDAETAGIIAEAIGLAAWEVMPDDEQVAA